MKHAINKLSPLFLYLYFIDYSSLTLICRAFFLYILLYVYFIEYSNPLEMLEKYSIPVNVAENFGFSCAVLEINVIRSFYLVVKHLSTNVV